MNENMQVSKSHSKELAKLTESLQGVRSEMFIGTMSQNHFRAENERVLEWKTEKIFNSTVLVEGIIRVSQNAQHEPEIESLQKDTLNESAIKGFIAIADLWGFTDKEKIKSLGLKNAKDLKVLQENPDKLSKTQREKISCIICIYDDLRTILGDKKSADTWLRRAEKEGFLLAGKTPLKRILSKNPNDIEEVYSYLAGVRHS